MMEHQVAKKIKKDRNLYHRVSQSLLTGARGIVAEWAKQLSLHDRM